MNSPYLNCLVWCLTWLGDFNDSAIAEDASPDPATAMAATYPQWVGDSRPTNPRRKHEIPLASYPLQVLRTGNSRSKRRRSPRHSAGGLGGHQARGSIRVIGYPLQEEYYGRYTPLCLAGLEKALNSTTDLYSRQLRHGRWEDTKGTEDLTSTCICLIGVDRSRIDPARLALDPRRTLAAAIRCASHRKYDGALGLLLWANAVTGGEEIEAVLTGWGSYLGDGAALASRLTSLETAWLLSGLLHEIVRNPQPKIRKIAETVIREIDSRYGRIAGLMPHAGANASMRHRVRNHLPNFADQIHTIQAMAFASIVLESKPALEFARKLAGRIVALQGPLGQWWWHYDTRSSTVAEPFPVFSVHQHAMAPMALMALAAAGGGDYKEAIRSSHQWLTRNELGINLVDEGAHTIWRSIERTGGSAARRIRQLRSLVGLHHAQPAEHPSALRLNRETRPYEWGWCLYAGAIANGLERGSHIV
jgi:hypothetical protein